jgi:hypothetical protein
MVQTAPFAESGFGNVRKDTEQAPAGNFIRSLFIFIRVSGRRCENLHTYEPVPFLPTNPMISMRD